MTDKIEHYYNVNRAAELLDVSTRTIHRWIDEGIITPTHLATGSRNTLRFSSSAIRDVFLEKPTAVKTERDSYRAALESILALPPTAATLEEAKALAAKVLR